METIRITDYWFFDRNKIPFSDIESIEETAKILNESATQKPNILEYRRDGKFYKIIQKVWD